MSVQTKNNNKQSNQPEVKLTRVQRNLRLVTMLNIILGLLSIFVPLIPTASVESPGNRTVFYSMIGAVNQDVGNATFREDAFALVVVFVIAAVFMAVGCISAYNQLRSSMLFTMASSVLCIIFMIMWYRLGDSATAGAMAVKPAADVYGASVIPVVVIIFALGTFVTSVMALIYNSMDIPRKQGTVSH